MSCSAGLTSQMLLISRPRSPHMNNEEPINLSHYPDGKKPDDESALRPIERDDFPGKSAGTNALPSRTTLLPPGCPGFGTINSLQSCAIIRTHASST